MARIVIENIEPEMLVRLGDEAARAGNFTLARGFYSTAQKHNPRPATAIRLGILRFPYPATPRLLEALYAVEPLDPRGAFVGDGLATWNKTLPSTGDERFRDLMEKHATLLPMANWEWNLATVAWAARQASHLEGDFVELGVFRGHTTLFTAEYLQFAEWPKRWLLYDTFSGIPEDQLDPGWAGSNVMTYRNTFSFEEVRDRFAHIPNIEVIKGRVPEILDERPLGQIAFLHMDLNNSAAEIAALDKLFDRIVPGGVIVFDDYGWAVSHAQRRAHDAWFSARGLIIQPLPTGQGVFVKAPS